MSKKILALLTTLSIIASLPIMSNHNPYSYNSQKLTGFTQIKGRRRFTKKQRKQLRAKKQKKEL